ncbi:MAG: DUF2892 domain-containing protein [Flavitalea sp.]
MVAIAIVILYFSNIIPGTLGIILLVISIVFALTSLVSFCPLYTVLCINTCKTKKIE